jgi:RND family efflux transporter MFP subunit
MSRGFQIIALIALAASGCSPSGAAPQGAQGAAPAMGVELKQLEASLVRDTSEYVATLKSRHSILLQPQVDGQLVKIFVKAGDTVEDGAVIMQINPARQQASVSSAQASRASRLATLNFARQQAERAERLFEGGAVSRQELDQARSSFESAKAEVDALGAQIRQSEVQLEYYRILAPAHGVIGDIPVRVGDYVTPQTRLTTIDENGLLEAYVSVPVERAKQLRPDLELQLVDAEGSTIGGGRITFISPQVNEETQSVLIKTVVHNDGNLLRAAQFVRARVVWSTHQGVTLPALAVTRINGQTFVYVAEQSAQSGGQLIARQRPVALGDLTDNAFVVLSGLKAGETVVTGGIQKLHDGAAIAAQRK